MTTATRESTQDPQLEEMAEDLAMRITRIDARLDAMATKEDVAIRSGELEKRMEVGFAEQRGEMDRRFAEQKGEMDRRFADLIGEMNRRFAEQDAKIAEAGRRQIVWTVGAMVAVGTLIVTVLTIMG